MFTNSKEVVIASKNRLRGKEQNEFLDILRKRYPESSEALLSLFEGKSIDLLRYKSKVNGYSFSDATLPFIMDVDTRSPLTKIIPTLELLWKLPDLLPSFLINSPTSENICGGADLMFPGIINNEGMKFEKGAYYSVKVRGNPAPFAVGYTLCSSVDAYSAGLSGHCLRMVHYFGDALWDSMGRNRPNPGFLGKSIIPIETVKEIPSGSNSRSTSDNESDEEDIEADDIDVNASHLLEQMEALDIDEGVGESGVSEDSHLSTHKHSREHKSSEAAFGSDWDATTLYERTFLQALHRSIKSADLPLLASSLGVHMQAMRPAGCELDIGKTEWKKLSVFLRHMKSTGVVDLKEQNGVISIVKVNKNSDLYKDHRVWSSEKTNIGASTNGPGHVVGGRPGKVDSKLLEVLESLGGSNKLGMNGNWSLPKMNLVHISTNMTHHFFLSNLLAGLCRALLAAVGLIHLNREGEALTLEISSKSLILLKEESPFSVKILDKIDEALVEVHSSVLENDQKKISLSSGDTKLEPLYSMRKILDNLLKLYLPGEVELKSRRKQGAFADSRLRLHVIPLWRYISVRLTVLLQQLLQIDSKVEVGSLSALSDPLISLLQRPELLVALFPPLNTVMFTESELSSLHQMHYHYNGSLYTKVTKTVDTSVSSSGMGKKNSASGATNKKGQKNTQGDSGKSSKNEPQVKFETKIMLVLDMEIAHIVEREPLKGSFFDEGKDFVEDSVDSIRFDSVDSLVKNALLCLKGTNKIGIAPLRVSPIARQVVEASISENVNSSIENRFPNHRSWQKYLPLLDFSPETTDTDLEWIDESVHSLNYYYFSPNLPLSKDFFAGYHSQHTKRTVDDDDLTDKKNFEGQLLSLLDKAFLTCQSHLISGESGNASGDSSHFTFQEYTLFGANFTPNIIAVASKYMGKYTTIIFFPPFYKFEPSRLVELFSRYFSTGVTILSANDESEIASIYKRIRNAPEVSRRMSTESTVLALQGDYLLRVCLMLKHLGVPPNFLLPVQMNPTANKKKTKK